MLLLALQELDKIVIYHIFRNIIESQDINQNNNNFKSNNLIINSDLYYFLKEANNPNIA